MTRLSRRRAAGLLAASLALVATACAGSDNVASPEAVLPATAAPAPATVAPTAVTEATSEAEATPTPPPAPAPEPLGSRRIELPEAVGATEGVAVDPATGRVFVGDLGNGDVWVGGIDGTPFELFAAAPSRSQAIGLAVDAAGDRLLIATGTSGTLDVHGLADGGYITSIELPVESGSLINDVVVADDGVVYVSDSGLPRIYRIAANTNEAELWVDYATGGVEATQLEGLQGNGLVVDDNWLLVAHMATGTLLRIERGSGDLTSLAVDDPAGGVGRDGLARCGDRLFGVEIAQLAGGPDRIWLNTVSEGAESIVAAGEILDETFASPSTIALLEDNLIVVNAQFGVAEPLRPFWLTVLPSGC